MNKLLTLFFIMIFMMSTSSFAGDKRIDVKGWNKAQWGMTKDQLIKAFKGQATEVEKKMSNTEKGMYEIVKTPNYDIEDITFQTTFLMAAKDDRLRKIRLNSDGAIELQFSRIKALFTQKYGSPKSDEQTGERGGDYTLKAIWFLPSTKIELTYATLQIAHTAFFAIWYSDAKVDKDALDQI